VAAMFVNDILVSDWSISKNLLLCNCLAKWTETWWEAPMEGSVLSFLKAEWKVSDTCLAHWASNATFNNISVISGQSVLLAEETGVPG
jgi:hypothetical protein